MSKFPLEVWLMSTITSTDSNLMSMGTVTGNSVQVLTPLSNSVPGLNGPKEALVSVPLLVQFSARETA